MTDEDKRSLINTLKEYKEIKDNNRHVNAFTQANQEKSIELLKKKNQIDASFEELENAYKKAGLHNE